MQRYKRKYLCDVNVWIMRTFSIIILGIATRFMLFAAIFVACGATDGTGYSVDPYTPPLDCGGGQTTRSIAFPGAEGGGMYATGGRGGEVCRVTTLEDDGPGSLREAIEKRGRRTIVFDVSGTIELKENLQIREGDVTIAGQSAPGDGICLKNYTLRVQADNVIIRFLRFRPGDWVVGNDPGEPTPDCIEGRNLKNVIIDHCSMSWSIDELSSWYANEDFTLQWCLLYESLKSSGHGKGDHGYTGLWGGNRASFHHNLLAHSDNRNPRVAHPLIEEVSYPDFVPGVIDFRNNVVYDWGKGSGYGGEGRKANFVNNYYKPGPSTATNRRTQIFEPYWTSENAYSQNSDKLSYEVSPLGTFYAAGNVMEGSPSVTDDNWQGFGAPKDGAGGYYRANSADRITARTATAEQKAAMKLSAAHDISEFPVTTHPAALARELVLEYAGAAFWREGKVWRDEADSRAIASVGNGTGAVIDRPGDVGGYPVLNASPAPADTDGDGMPDAWETSGGLNPRDPSDANKYTLEERYTNLEVYLNSLVADIIAAQNDPQ
jgi:pectate lyase